MQVFEGGVKPTSITKILMNLPKWVPSCWCVGVIRAMVPAVPSASPRAPQPYHVSTPRLWSLLSASCFLRCHLEAYAARCHPQLHVGWRVRSPLLPWAALQGCVHRCHAHQRNPQSPFAPLHGLFAPRRRSDHGRGARHTQARDMYEKYDADRRAQTPGEQSVTNPPANSQQTAASA